MFFQRGPACLVGRWRAHHEGRCQAYTVTYSRSERRAGSWYIMVVDSQFCPHPAPTAVWYKEAMSVNLKRHVPKYYRLNKATQEEHFPCSSRRTVILPGSRHGRFPSLGTPKPQRQRSWKRPSVGMLRSGACSPQLSKLKWTLQGNYYSTLGVSYQNLQPLSIWTYTEVMLSESLNNSNKISNPETHQCFNLSSIRNNGFSFQLEPRKLPKRPGPTLSDTIRSWVVESRFITSLCTVRFLLLLQSCCENQHNTEQCMSEAVSISTPFLTLMEMMLMFHY